MLDGDGKEIYWISHYSWVKKKSKKTQTTCTASRDLWLYRPDLRIFLRTHCHFTPKSIFVAISSFTFIYKMHENRLYDQSIPDFCRLTFGVRKSAQTAESRTHVWMCMRTLIRTQRGFAGERAGGGWIPKMGSFWTMGNDLRSILYTCRSIVVFQRPFYIKQS